MSKRLEFSKSETKGFASGTIITDSQTGVQYLAVSLNGASVAMSVMVDKDGKPVIAQKN